MERDRRTAREKELDEVVNGYIDILTVEGAESRKELAYLRKYAGDPEALKLLRGARAVKAMFEAFGDFPDLERGRPRAQRRTAKSKSL